MRDFQQGNAVHALSVATDGTLSESNPPVTFSAADAPAAARLQGVAVVAPHVREDADDGPAWKPAIAMSSCPARPRRPRRRRLGAPSFSNSPVGAGVARDGRDNGIGGARAT